MIRCLTCKKCGSDRSIVVSLHLSQINCKLCKFAWQGQNDPKYIETRRINAAKPESRKNRKEYRKNKRKTNSEFRLKEYKQNSKYKVKRSKIDPIFALKRKISCRLSQAFKRKKLPKKGLFSKSIGCSYDFFYGYIESRFQPGMTWENYGQFGWQIDHIIPLSVATSPEELYKLNHYTNLQPMWWQENIKKSNKLIVNGVM